MKKRLIFLTICMILVLCALIVRLVEIQIIDREKYASVTARQQRVTLDGVDKRGTIYDRKMNPLTGDDEDYVYIIEKSKMDVTAARIMESIGVKRVKNPSTRYYVYRGSAYDQDIANVLRRDYNVFMMKSARRYSDEQTAVHLIGYVNVKDGNGACGIEKDFNDILSRKQKIVYASVDGKRMIIPGLGIYSTIENPDCGVITTLDKKIQKKAETILKASGHQGAIIVNDARTGEVLASASSPAYDPNQIEEYLDSSNKEFINKATQSEYPPGSIFKIIVAAAALEKGVVTPDTTFTCKGYEEINGIRIDCTGGENGHGTLSFREAFAKSCNSTFIQVGMLTGGKEILEMAKSFGIGEKTLAFQSDEKKGVLPDSDDIQGAGIGNLSIGQGTILVTPMQAARMTTIIASGGIDPGMSLIKGVMSDGKIKYTKAQEPKRVISYETAQIIKDFMVDTVDYGTANNLKSDLDIKIAGKTGSAEALYYGEKTVHGWFTGFLPADNPAYVITVFVESGGSGRSSAVPLFQQMAEELY
jgi:Cell division protein FtsI/penicillin-binding protein 2